MRTAAGNVDERFDRTRARNRAAQSRLRQRQQAERNAIDGRLHDARRDVTAARERYVALQRQRVERSTRNADAALALAALRPQQPPSPAGCTAAAAAMHTSRLSLRTSLDLPNPATTMAAAAHRSGLCDMHDLDERVKNRPPHHGCCGVHTDTRGSCPARSPGTALTCIRKHRSPFTLQQPWSQPPRPIAAFDSVAGISYDDLRAAADPTARFVDFSQHALSDIVARVLANKAEQLGVARVQVRGDVCWFVQTPYEVAEGTPLSASMSMNSVECIASFGLHYLMSRLEFMLIAAATPGSGGGARRAITELYSGGRFEQDLGSDDSSGTMGEAPPAKVPLPPGRRASGPAEGAHGSASSLGSAAKRANVQSSGAPEHDAAQHAQHARHAPAASAANPTDATASPPVATSGPTTAHSVPAPHGPLWSRRVRCGVHETHDAACAVRTILHSVVRSCCREIPLRTLHRLLSSYHDALQRMISSFSQPQGQGGGGGHGGGTAEDPDGFKARSMAASCGIAALTIDAVDAVADMQTLRQLQAEGCRGGPAAVEGDSAEQRLGAQAHNSAAGFALLHYLALREAPQIVRSLCHHGVFPLCRLDEVDSLHIHLYRGLRLTDEDRARLVTHWRKWSQVCTTLNAPFHSALSTLRSLPQAADIPAALIARINAAAAETRVQRDRGAGGGAGARMHLHWMSGGGRADSVPAADEAAVGCASGERMQFLGSSAEVTEVAEQGLLGLHAVHDLHGRVRRETMILQMQPGVLLQPLQLARVWSAHISSGTAPADFMNLSRLAAAQQRWRDMASRPAVLQSPLPKHQ